MTPILVEALLAQVADRASDRKGVHHCLSRLGIRNPSDMEDILCRGFYSNLDWDLVLDQCVEEGILKLSEADRIALSNNEEVGGYPKLLIPLCDTKGHGSELKTRLEGLSDDRFREDIKRAAAKVKVGEKLLAEKVDDDDAVLSSREIWQGALSDLYVELNLLRNKSEINFAAYHFTEKFWIETIWKAQSDKTESDNHLHQANNEICKLISDYYREKWKANRAGPVVMRVLEGGVGGANTTRRLLQALQYASEDARQELDTVYYRGFELFPNAAVAANKILCGVESMESPGTEEFKIQLGRNDPRLEFFRSIHGKHRFMPMLHDGLFVDAVSMHEGIHELSKPRFASFMGNVDLFVSSYTFHHVPNSRFLKMKIFQELHNQQVLIGPGGFKEDVVNGLDAMLKKGFPHNCYMPNRGMTPEAQALLTRLNLNDHRLQALKKFVEDHAHVFKREGKLVWNNSNNDGLALHEWRRWISDEQEMTLANLYSLLKPGGLLVLADPDGLSQFNRRKVEETPEMAIAFFRHLESGTQEDPSTMTSMLERHGFDILGGWYHQLRYSEADSSKMRIASSPTLEKPEHDRNLLDQRLGYVVVARKPD